MKREEPKPRAISAKIEPRTNSVGIKPREHINPVSNYNPVPKNLSPQYNNNYGYNPYNRDTGNNNNESNMNSHNHHPVSNNIYNKDNNIYTPGSNNYRINPRPSTNINYDIYKLKPKKYIILTQRYRHKCCQTNQSCLISSYCNSITNEKI